MQRFKNGLQDTIGIRHHIAVPEAQYSQAVRPEESVAPCIVRHLLDMLAAIQLDDDSRLQANEVTNIRPERALAPEFEAVYLPTS